MAPVSKKRDDLSKRNWAVKITGLKTMFNGTRSPEPTKPHKPTSDDLVKAIYTRDAEFVKSLLKRGADVNELSWNHTTPLFVAASMDSPEIMRLLIADGADPNGKSGGRGTTALMVVRDNLECAGLLLEKGAHIDAKDIDGLTPLMFTSISGYPKVARFLIEQGALLDEKDKDGLTALDHARQNCEEIVQIILSAKAERQRQQQEKKGRALRAAVTLRRNLPYKKSPFRIKRA